MKENEKVIDIGKELKKQELRQKTDALKKKIKTLWDENKVAIAVIVPAVGTVVAKGIQVIGRRHNLKIEERNRDRRVYDTSLGHYWELRRKLDNRDWTEINRRRNRGESLGEILEEMRVLK